MLGQWVCYALQGEPPFDAATSRMEAPLPGETTAFFIQHAEETLPHLAKVSLPLWQFVGPGNQGSHGAALLSRGTIRHQDGKSTAVVWGLLLPPEFVASSRFALQPCLGLFPPDDPGAPWPAALDLERLPPAPPAGEAAQRLAATYLYVGELRSPPAPAAQPAVVPLVQLVELLPPGDRAPISFATAPLGLRRVEIDPGMGTGPQPGPDALARLRLWDAVRRVIDTPDPDTSLHQDPETWLAPVAQLPHLPARIIALLQMLGSEDLPAELRQSTLAWVHRTLEHWLTDRAGPHEAASTLDELCRVGLLARHDLFPPLWPARVAAKRQVLGTLSPETLAQILRPDPEQLLQVLLTGLRRGPVAAKTADLVAGLARAPADVSRQLLAAAGPDMLTELGTEPDRLHTDAELATAVALLAMHFNGRGSSASSQGK